MASGRGSGVPPLIWEEGIVVGRGRMRLPNQARFGYTPASHSDKISALFIGIPIVELWLVFAFGVNLPAFEEGDHR